MTSAVSAPQGATDEEKPTGQRRRISRLPLWVRLSAVTALVLLGVFLASTLLGGSGPADRSPGGDHGSGGEMQMDSGSGGQHGSDDSGSGGGHGSDD